ncbi:MAG: pseudaminic acid synthase [Gammaproteobacteria bacterium]|nr:pseudaminic acid synthase [Gammaproteobacteria bacterium]
MITLGHINLTENSKPLIVAELSGNHQQSYELAEQMIVAAAKSGADAIKLQTYTADTMTLDCDKSEFQIDESSSLWQGENLFSLYEKASTPWQWHERLFNKAKSLGLLAFSSPFDISSVNFLETLAVPCYKIASFENNDLPLIKRVAQTGKPIIMSTGMASIEEIELAIDTIHDQGNEQIILLKCTSNYPAKISDANLVTILDMKKRFNCAVGLSDHSLGINVSLASVALGACLIEKHFVLDKNAGGIDSDFSIDAVELEQLVHGSKAIHQALGKVKYDGSESEQQSKKYRRSIYISQNINAGDKLNESNMRIIRPGYGLAPKYYEQILGKQVNQSIEVGTPLSWELIMNTDK